MGWKEGRERRDGETRRDPTDLRFFPFLHQIRRSYRSRRLHFGSCASVCLVGNLLRRVSHKLTLFFLFPVLQDRPPHASTRSRPLVLWFREAFQLGENSQTRFRWEEQELRVLEGRMERRGGRVGGVSREEKRSERRDPQGYALSVQVESPSMVSDIRFSSLLFTTSWFQLFVLHSLPDSSRLVSSSLISPSRFLSTSLCLNSALSLILNHRFRRHQSIHSWFAYVHRRRGAGPASPKGEFKLACRLLPPSTFHQPSLRVRSCKMPASKSLLPFLPRWLKGAALALLVLNFR